MKGFNDGDKISFFVAEPGLAGRRTNEGRLVGCDDTGMTVETEGEAPQTVFYPWCVISSVTLVETAERPGLYPWQNP